MEHARAWHGVACGVPVPRRGACVPARCGRAGGVGSARGGELPSSAREEERGAALERAEQEAREEGWRGRAARQRWREGERKRKEEKEKGKWEREKEKEGERERERKKREGERFAPDPRRAVGHAQRRSRVRARVRARVKGEQGDGFGCRGRVFRGSGDRAEKFRAQRLIWRF